MSGVKVYIEHSDNVITLYDDLYEGEGYILMIKAYNDKNNVINGTEYTSFIPLKKSREVIQTIKNIDKTNNDVGIEIEGPTTDPPDKKCVVCGEDIEHGQEFLRFYPDNLRNTHVRAGGSNNDVWVCHRICVYNILNKINNTVGKRNDIITDLI